MIGLEMDSGYTYYWWLFKKISVRKNGKFRQANNRAIGMDDSSGRAMLAPTVERGVPISLVIFGAMHFVSLALGER